MTDLPKMKPRNMATGLGEVVSTHQQIEQGIQERAAAEEEYRKNQDQKLNAESQVTRGGKV